MSKEAVARHKAKQEAAGLIRKHYWIKPKWHRLIVALINKLKGE